MTRRVGGFIGAIAFACVATATIASAGSAPPDARSVRSSWPSSRLVRQAHVDYVQSRPAAFKALWSRSPEVTIFGGFGSGERGWDKVGPRLDWASAQLSEGSRSHEIITSHVDGNLGYVAQLERVRFKSRAVPRNPCSSYALP